MKRYGFYLAHGPGEFYPTIWEAINRAANLTYPRVSIFKQVRQADGRVTSCMIGVVKGAGYGGEYE